MVQNGSFYFLQRHKDNKFQWLHDADFPRYIFFSEASQAPVSSLSIHEPFPEAVPKAARHSGDNSQIDRRLKQDKRKPKKRSEREENYIRNAKFLLMDRNHLSEEEAHRYIQKCSMDNATNMVETAQMILMLIYDEC